MVIPATLLARGALDEIPGLNDTNQRFFEAAVARGMNITVMQHAQGHHGLETRDRDARIVEILQLSAAS